MQFIVMNGAARVVRGLTGPNPSHLRLVAYRRERVRLLPLQSVVLLRSPSRELAPLRWHPGWAAPSEEDRRRLDVGHRQLVTWDGEGAAAEGWGRTNTFRPLQVRVEFLGRVDNRTCSAL